MCDEVDRLVYIIHYDVKPTHVWLTSWLDHTSEVKFMYVWWRMYNISKMSDKYPNLF